MSRSQDIAHRDVPGRVQSDSTHSAEPTTGNTIESANLTKRPIGEERRKRIAETAYRRAELRGFAPGGEVDDWLAAERDFDAAGGSSAD